MEEVNTQGTSQASIAPSDLPEESHVDHLVAALPSSWSQENSQGSGQSQQRAEDDPAAKVVDTAAPIDSVKGAVSKFGGILDWRERRVQIQDELDKVQVEMRKYQKRSQEAEAAMTELASTSSLVDELRVGVERVQAEEAQARREADVAELRLREVERGASESAAARAELGVVRDRSAAAVAELQAARAELAALKKAAADAEAVSAREREAGKAVEELAGELVALKRELEAAHAAHSEVEEKRVAIAEALEDDKSQWQSELEEAEVEAKKLREELMAACELEFEAEAASEQLARLKAQLAAEAASKEASKLEALEEVKGSIDRAKGETDHLRIAAGSLREILGRGKAEIAALQSKELLSAASIASLQEELHRAQAALMEEKDHDHHDEKVGESRREAEQAKAKAHSAREAVAKAREEASLVKAAVAAMEARLEAVTREILAAKASEEMATASASALLQLHLPAEESGGGVTLTTEEYEDLSRRAAETEEAAGERVVEAVKLIKEAKDAEVRSLEMLTRAARQTEQRRQALQAATEEAEESEFAKLSAERELRQWRADHDHHPRPGLAEISVLDDPYAAGNPHILSPRGGYIMPRNDAMMAAADGAAAEADARHRKTTFLPRMVMFLARKKAHNWK